MKITKSIAGFAILVLSTTTAFAQLTIYPTKGQSSKQQEKDKFECYDWAKKQTGFNPEAQATQQQQPGQQKQGQVAKGAAGGAIVGGIAGDAGKGAAAGAGAGALGKRGAKKEAQQQQSQQQSQQQQQLTAFNKAEGACLQGRGYSVK